jgi:hypothetical protein
LLSTLERLFIAFARTLRTGIVSGQGSTGHGLGQGLVGRRNS